MNYAGHPGMQYSDDLPPPPGVDSDHYQGPSRDPDQRDRDRLRRHDRSRSRDYRHDRDDGYGYGEKGGDGRNYYGDDCYGGNGYGSKRSSGYSLDRSDEYIDREERRSYRERERFRERDRDRGRDRDRDRDRGRDRDHSRERERNWDRDRDRMRDNDWREEIPNNTIMVRGLGSHVSETDIRNEITRYGLQVKDIRLMRRKETGLSRGFAFVEFQLLSEAVRWKELTQGLLFFDGQYRATLHYSIPKDMIAADRGLLNKADWTCSKCGVNNFRRRDLCFKCNAPRDDAEILQASDGYDEISSYPSNTLLFRNLDVLTTEERVLSMLGQLTMLPIKSLRVAKDSLTNTSRGFAFVELHSTSEATQLHDLLVSMAGNFFVDGRQVTVSYARRSLTAMNGSASANAASVALAAAQWTNQGASYSSSDTSQNFRTSDQGVAGSSVITDAPPLPNRNQSSDLGTVVVNGVNYQRCPIPDVSSYKYDESSGYYFDSTTGLYYDSNSQYYYNCESQQFLYWDGDRQIYLPAPSSVTSSTTQSSASVSSAEEHYQSSVSTSAPPVLAQSSENADLKPDGEGDASAKKESDAAQEKREKGGKQDKVKIAKKIAKDMEKWAKTLNQKKENAKMGIFISPMSVPLNEIIFKEQFVQPATADAGFAILEKRTTPSERNALVAEALRKSKEQEEKKLAFAVAAAEKPLALVASYGGDSDSESEVDFSDEGSKAFDALKLEELKLTDWPKLACLMCKRQFPAKEALLRHQQLSDLHKQNLDVLKLTKLTPQQLKDLEKREREAGYRDRAKERRKKFGQPDDPHPNRLKNKYLKERDEQVIPPEQPTAAGIGSDNIGNKMLKAMGWSEGQGLGKSGQGMSGIIEVQKRVKTAGLGMKGSSYGATAGDSYKDAVKKAMQARYNEIA